MSTNPHGIPVNAVRDTAYYTEEPVSTGEYVLSILLTMIPIVGFFLTLVWAFGSSTKVGKRNFARATLIWMVILFAIAVVVMISLGSLIANYAAGLNLPQ